MKKYLLLTLALLASTLTFAQDPLVDANSHANAILADVSAAQSQVAALNATITQNLSTIQSQQSTIDSDGETIASDSQQIQQLQSQLAAAQSSATQVPSSILFQFANLQSLAGWVLAPGKAGNTGQSGSGGTGTFTANSDGTATLTNTPAGPYYDTFFYRKSSVIPHPVAGYIGYRADWCLDANNLPLSQAIEMDGSDYDGHWRYQPALQVEMGSHLLRYYNPALPGWVSTGIPVTVSACNPQTWAGALTVEMLTKIDSVNGKLTYVGVAINGKVYPLNITVGCKSTTNVWIESSLQLDSNSKAQAYKAFVKNVGMYWF